MDPNKLIKSSPTLEKIQWTSPNYFIASNNLPYWQPVNDASTRRRMIVVPYMGLKQIG